MDLMQALAVIDRVADRAEETQERGEDLVEAMTFLRDWGVDRLELAAFWKCLEGENALGRWQSANALRNRIRFLVNKRRQELKEDRKPNQNFWRH